MSEPRRLVVARDGRFADVPAEPIPADRWVKHGGHWANAAWPGWFAWRGSPGYYARRRLSSPPLVVGPLAELSDLSLAIGARLDR
jgi:hypothetical protein